MVGPTLHQDANWWKRCVAESLLMLVQTEPLSQPSVDVSSIYLGVVVNDIFFYWRIAGRAF